MTYILHNYIIAIVLYGKLYVVAIPFGVFGQTCAYHACMCSASNSSLNWFPMWCRIIIYAYVLCAHCAGCVYSRGSQPSRKWWSGHENNSFAKSWQFTSKIEDSAKLCHIFILFSFCARCMASCYGNIDIYIMLTRR